MSDVIGLAASIAGLAGFSGQLLEGCLFLKGFLDDLKHASSDIKYLATEIQLIQSITREISSKAQQVAQSVTWKVQEKDDCETAFRLCTESIKDLGQDIAKHSQRIEGKGSKRWWASLKAAIGKKALTEKLNRIERAKQKILMVQNSLSLHLEQDTCKQVINTSNVINTTLSQLQNEQNASFELIQEMNDYASQTYYGVSDMAKRMERIESGLQSLAPAILQGFLKGAVASAVEQHHLQLADHQDANIPAAMNSISTHPEPSGRRQRFERKHVILWTEYNFLLLKVAVETTKRWPILLDQTSEEDRSGGPQIETTYYILTNFPFWKRYIRINSAGNVSSLLSPGADLRMEVTTHGVFSDNSPIYKAVMNCDVDERWRVATGDFYGFYSPKFQHDPYQVLFTCETS
ncbi:hypothetical protein PVAG01_10632 [Phlyctema vagabunda]|uniref:Fungal N-terminal domain-containing protein n=1 Tax=Phlyctema vagabunda TaxID=108571 RepID=A0ABR4P371_9HELO